MGRPRSEEARDTRRDILEAALDLFAERGFHATSMRALAAAVGVRESAIYHHFPSKEAILLEVAADRSGQVSSVLHGELAGVMARPLEEILTVFARIALEHITSPAHQKLMRILLADGAALISDNETSFRQLAEEPRKALGRALAQLKRDGKVRDDLELEMFHVHFMMPLLVASGALFGGAARPFGTMPIHRFVKQHVALMARAIAPSRGRK